MRHVLKVGSNRRGAAMHQRIPAFVAILALTLGAATAHCAETRELERVLDQWAIAWSSSDTGKLLPLFTDNVVYEDVTFGAVSKGKTALRDFAAGAFGAYADMTFELKSRMVAA